MSMFLEKDGLKKLFDSVKEIGFKELEQYSSPCDLCTHVRKFLFENRPTPDLGPNGFYDERSVNW